MYFIYFLGAKPNSCQHLLHYIGFLHHATFHSNNIEIIYNRGQAGPKFDVTLEEEEGVGEVER
jgi:hypothetical protein